jgi:hypothetical protein
MLVAKSGFFPPRLSKQLGRPLLQWHRFCVQRAVTVTRVVAIRFSQVAAPWPQSMDSKLTLLPLVHLTAGSLRCCYHHRCCHCRCCPAAVTFTITDNSVEVIIAIAVIIQVGITFISLTIAIPSTVSVSVNIGS